MVEINGFFIIKKNYGLIRLMEVYEMTRQKASKFALYYILMST